MAPGSVAVKAMARRLFGFDEGRFMHGSAAGRRRILVDRYSQRGRMRIARADMAPATQDCRRHWIATPDQAPT